jgi:glycerol-3-phosphate acyltransferase PlsY
VGSMERVIIEQYAELFVIAYLLGSIPFGYVLVRLFRGTDVRTTGSGNIGATNVARSAPGLGIATLILDAAKGYAAVYLAMSGKIGPTDMPDTFYTWHMYMVGAGAALCAILGHVFPVWLKFRGGKGVATGVGAFLALAPKALLVVLVIFVALVFVFRYVSLGSIVATAAFPVCAYFLKETNASTGVLVLMVAASLLIIAKHHQNIRRLLTGTEHRFTLKRTSA